MSFYSFTSFLLLFPLFPLKTSCQNITVGTILSPLTNRSYVLSPSGDFAFGFHALDSDPLRFVLAVYYNKIKAKTVTWTANGDNPVSNKSKAQLTSDGQLTLQDSSDLQIWSSNSGMASYCSMSDDGNFILYSSDSSVVWQTFDSPTDQTRTATGIRGTIGYFAPEWFKNTGISAKVDVYSFGVMLLQIICCKKNFEWGLESHQRTTVIDWAKKCLENERLDLLVEDDEEAKSDVITLERFVMVGISCAEDEPWLRPSMKKVVQMLEGTTECTCPLEDLL